MQKSTHTEFINRNIQQAHSNLVLACHKTESDGKRNIGQYLSRLEKFRFAVCEHAEYLAITKYGMSEATKHVNAYFNIILKTISSPLYPYLINATDENQVILSIEDYTYTSAYTKSFEAEYRDTFNMCKSQYQHKSPQQLLEWIKQRFPEYKQLNYQQQLDKAYDYMVNLTLNLNVNKTILIDQDRKYLQNELAIPLHLQKKARRHAMHCTRPTDSAILTTETRRAIREELIQLKKTLTSKLTSCGFLDCRKRAIITNRLGSLETVILTSKRKKQRKNN